MIRDILIRDPFTLIILSLIIVITFIKYNNQQNKHHNQHHKHKTPNNKWISTPKKARKPGHANHVFKKKTL